MLEGRLRIFKAVKAIRKRVIRQFERFRHKAAPVQNAVSSNGVPLLAFLNKLLEVSHLGASLGSASGLSQTVGAMASATSKPGAVSMNTEIATQPPLQSFGRTKRGCGGQAGKSPQTEISGISGKTNVAALSIVVREPGSAGKLG